jgi:hypothetical protein
VSTFLILSPEVPGGLGPGSIIDRSDHPPRVSRLAFIFDGWLGDDLVESFPVFLVTDALAKTLNNSELTGYLLKEADISVSEQFLEFYPNAPSPQFVWLDVVGDYCRDDFSLDSRARLVVSERAYQVLRTARLEHCEVEQIEGT